MIHHCHALGCGKPCSPRHLMCLSCWSKVPADLQTEVYRTVRLRGPVIDKTWAPWWRAQAKAIAYVARETFPDVDKNNMLLKRAMEFADKLEEK